MIKSKYFNIILAVTLSAAIIFSVVITYFPDSTEVSASSVKTRTIMDYEVLLFQSDNVMNVDISVDETSWNSMLENALNEEYIVCDVTVNGTKYYNVGIRTKGNTSLTQIASDSTTDRYSLKIEFDHYVDNQTLYGLDKLVLNNIMSDSTYMKEYLSYDMMNFMNIASPLYGYAQITVNGNAWGLYLALEGMEESFAQRNYGNNYGQLYKPETTGMGGGGMSEQPQAGENSEGMLEQPQAGQNKGNMEIPLQNRGDSNMKSMTSDKMEMDMTRGGFGGTSKGSDLKYIDDETDSYSEIFDNAVFDINEEDKEKVVTALKNLSTRTDLEKYIDVDAVLRYFAVNTVLVNLDSYVSSMRHNYILYESEGKLTMLPWDYNLSFAGFQSNNSTSAVNFPIDTPVSGTTLEERPILGRLLEVEEYKELYHKYLQEIVTNYFNSGYFETKIQRIDQLISQYVKEDATAFYTYDEYQKGVSTLTDFGILRAESIQGQLNGIIPATEEGQTADPSALVNADSINITDMGTMGGGGKADGHMGENSFGNREGKKNKAEFENPAKNEENLDDVVPAMGNMSGNRNNMNFNNMNNKIYRELIITGISIVMLFAALLFVKFFKRRKYRI